MSICYEYTYTLKDAQLYHLRCIKIQIKYLTLFKENYAESESIFSYPILLPPLQLL